MSECKLRINFLWTLKFKHYNFETFSYRKTERKVGGRMNVMENTTFQAFE